MFKTIINNVVENKQTKNLKDGAQETVELVIIRDPLEPIFINTHFVQELFFSNSWPAFIGFFVPVSDSAYHTIKFLNINITHAYHPPSAMPFMHITDF
jgi:hypothetical protein